MDQIIASAQLDEQEIFTLLVDRPQLRQTQTHHMIYRELGGSSKQRNEVTLPVHIHHRLHAQYVEMLPHEMILSAREEYTARTVATSSPSSTITDIYQPHIRPDL
jgi:hypothetical protein